MGPRIGVRARVRGLGLRLGGKGLGYKAMVTVRIRAWVRS